MRLDRLLAQEKISRKAMKQALLKKRNPSQRLSSSLPRPKC